MRMRIKTLLAMVFIFLLTGCALPGATAPTPAIDHIAIITAAAGTAFVKLTEIAGLPSSTPLAAATATPEPPTPTATVEVKFEPVSALCTINATVRAQPRKGSENLGGVFYNHSVQVVARNDKGSWYYILWPESPSGKAWVNSGAFTLKGEVGLLPVAIEIADGKFIFMPPVVWTITGTPLPLPAVPNDPAIRRATVTQLANVRVCPSTGCLGIGRLNIGEQIIMTGRIAENGWAQFEFPSGPGGKAWISRDFILPGEEGFGGLPYFDLMGYPVTPEPPTSTPDPNSSPTPIPTEMATPAGPLAEITDLTTVYTLQSSLSPIVGTLKSKDKIYVTAQSLNGLWFEIQYPLDSTGRAYISSKYVRLLGDFRRVPYTDSRGTPFPTP